MTVMTGPTRDDSNSAYQGITQDQYSEKISLCCWGGVIDASCMNIRSQNQANTGNSALGQQGGSGENNGDGGNSADQGINQGQ